MRLPGRFPLDHPVGHDWFALGVNYPYIWTQGSDIGPNQILRRESTAFSGARLEQLRRDFERMKHWGVDVVRMFAFEDGEGLTWRRAGDHWVVAGIHPLFLQHASDIALAAQAVGIRIYWCLLQSANFDVSRYSRRPPQYTEMSRSFRYMLENSHAREPFFEAALRPFVHQALLGAPAGLFAIDLMNEPDCLWAAATCNVDETLARTDPMLGLGRYGRYLHTLLSLNGNFSAVSSLSELYQRRDEGNIIDLLVEMARFIRTNYQDRVPVSTGFAFSNTFRRHLRVLNDVFDFFDFHFYDTIDVADCQPNLPAWNDLAVEKPCIIGECGLGGQIVRDVLCRPVLGPGLQAGLGRVGEYLERRIGRGIGQFPLRTTLQDIFSAQRDLISHCLTRALRNGFAGCLIWEYGRQFRFVFEQPRLLTETGNCPRSGCQDSEASGCLAWRDRIPLLWKKTDQVQVSPEMCVHLSSESDAASDGLCGRPAVTTVRGFADRLGPLSPGF